MEHRSEPPPPIADSLRLSVDENAPARARRYLIENAAELPADLMEDALLLVSELVTNAIRYGQPDITLQVRREPPGIGVDIHDAGADLPVLPATRPDHTELSGRGLLIVDALATDWGVTSTDTQPGKTVWFQLSPS